MRAAIAKLEAPYREKFFRDRKKRFAPDVQTAIETVPEKRTPLQWILYYKGLPQLEMGPIDIKTMPISRLFCGMWLLEKSEEF